MSLAVYAYVLLFTALVAAAAAAVEWGAQGRIPVRHLWSAAILIALLGPPVILASHAASISAMTRNQADGGATENRLTTVVVNPNPAIVPRVSALASRIVPIRVVVTPKPRWRALAVRIRAKISARFIRVIVPLWICASTAFVIWLLIGALHWRRARRSWHRAVIDGVQIEISPATGPAVLGVISHRIVMPAWAMSMPAERRKLMLAHECEHVRARDPERLAVAVAALVLMPWNAVLWWCAARLRRAIELDCDARVLRRYPGAKEYGHLLLDVASRGHGFGSIGIPSVALLRLPSELELRLRAMTQRGHTARRAVVAGSGIAIVAVAAAFTTPVPDLAMLRPVASRSSHVILLRPPVMLHRVTVRVGRSQIAFDSATYSVMNQTISATPATISKIELGTGTVDTTIKSHRDTVAILERKVDSLQSVASQMAARTRELAVMRARMDSAEAALSRRSSDLNVKDAARTLTITRALGPEFERTGSYIDAALQQYYPGLRAGDRDARVWFIADTSGRVLQTMRDDAARLSVSPEIVHTRFRNVDPGDILFMSIRPRAFGNGTVNVTWVEIRNQAHD